MGKLLLGILIIVIGIVVGWSTFGGNNGSISLPKLPGVLSKSTPSVTPAPSPTSSLAEYRFTETTVKATPKVGENTTKGGVVLTTTPTVIISTTPKSGQSPTKAALVQKSPTPTIVISRATASVRHTDTGFKEMLITVKAGTTVTFVNDSATSMWVISSPHEEHDALPGFDQKQAVGKGGTFSYVFTKIGTWKYHNESSIGQTGVIIVTE